MMKPLTDEEIICRTDFDLGTMEDEPIWTTVGGQLPHS